MKKNTCKYCKGNTPNLEVCAYCKEKLLIISRIQKMLNN